MIPKETVETIISPEIIGIAGFMGAGKSIVSRILRCNGFLVYDCDREANLLMNNDVVLRNQLKKILGNLCFDSNNTINKQYVAARIFNNRELRQCVNSVVHEAVRNDFLKMAEKSSGKVFVESAIMSTSGLDKLCNKIWVIDAPENIRLNRVMLRNNLSEYEIRKRMIVQKNELSVLPKYKIILIKNDGISDLLIRVIRLVSPQMESSCIEYSLQMPNTPKFA